MHRVRTFKLPIAAAAICTLLTSLPAGASGELASSSGSNDAPLWTLDGIHHDEHADASDGLRTGDPESTVFENPLSYLHVAGASLRPRDSTVTWDATGNGAGCVYQTGGSSSEVFNVHIELPPGVLVESVRMYYRDFVLVGGSTGWLTRYSDGGDISQEWSVSSIGDTGAGSNVRELIDEVIDYEPTSYVLNWRSNHIGSEQALCGFRITYRRAFPTILSSQVDNPTVARRKMVVLKNNGSPEILMEDTSTGIKWNFAMRGTGFEMNRGGSGQTEYLFRASGDATAIGTWIDSSSRALKHEFEAIDPSEVLDKVTGLPLSRWSYLKDGTDVRHIGPMSEDFYSTFGVGLNDRGIAALDSAGVALAAIQGLDEKTRSANESLRADNDALRQRIEELERHVRALLEP